MTTLVAAPAASERAFAFLRDRVAPRAAEIDRSVDALREVLQEAGKAGILALKRPEAFGGPAMEEGDFRRFQEEAARASGAFAFLQTQHQSAVALVSRYGDPQLQESLLPLAHDGTRTVGVGFSQLRREGDPLVRAVPEGDGYRVTGHVPWVTGYGLFGEYLLGATLPNGDSLFAVVPLDRRDGQTPSAPMRLAAMETAQTIALDLEDFLVKSEQVAFIRPASFIRDNDTVNIALQSQFAFGCAQAGLDIVRREGEKPAKAFALEAVDALGLELDRCRRETDASRVDLSEATAPDRLRLRAWAIDLAVRCAHAAIAASAGAANSLDHPAQRVYREALVYTVSAQTLPIMRATLDRLVARSDFGPL